MAEKKKNVSYYARGEYAKAGMDMAQMNSVMQAAARQDAAARKRTAAANRGSKSRPK